MPNKGLAWTAMLTATVAVTSLCPEMAFVWAVSPHSTFSKACNGDNAMRVLAIGPGEVLCLPALFFRKSKLDVVVPPVFAALVVAGSACFIRAIRAGEEETATA